MPRPTPMGIRHDVFTLAREGIKQGAIAACVGLTHATVNRMLKRHAATGSLVPGKSSGAPRKTTPLQDRALLRMVQQDRFLSTWCLSAWLLDELRFQLYPVDGRLRVRHLPGERFRPGCQAHRVQAGGGLVHVWGTFHNSAKSPLVLPDGYLTSVLYRGILQKTLLPFGRHYFGDNCYQDDSATPHRARVVFDDLQQGNVTEMEQPPRSPDCNPIELWDELGRAISSMDNPPQNLDELR